MKDFKTIWKMRENKRWKKKENGKQEIGVYKETAIDWLEKCTEMFLFTISK